MMAHPNQHLALLHSLTRDRQSARPRLNAPTMGSLHLTAGVGVGNDPAWQLDRSRSLCLGSYLSPQFHAPLRELGDIHAAIRHAR
jgi:hypothetical protein